MSKFLEITVTRLDGTAYTADVVRADAPGAQRLADRIAWRELSKPNVASVHVRSTTQIAQSPREI